MITFKKTPDEDNIFDHIEVTISTEAIQRDGILDAFLGFMTACGFSMEDVAEAIEMYDPGEDPIEQSEHKHFIDKLSAYNKV